MTEIISPPDSVPEASAPSPEPTPPRVPAAPPSQAWLEAEAEAEALCATLDRTAHAQWQAWIQAITTDILEPLHAIVQQALTTHGRLIEQAALDAATTEEELWQRVTAYREAVAKTVMVPLRGFMARRTFGDALGAGCETMLEPLVPLADQAASHRTLPRPFTLYAQEADDKPVRRLRKSLVRAGRRLHQVNLGLLNGLRRLFRLEPLPLPAWGRLVPLREVCLYHAHVRVPGRVVLLHERLQQHVAGLVARLETALTDWTHTLLDAERRLDQIAFHQPEILSTVQDIEDDEPEESEAAAPSIDPEIRTAFTGVAEALQRALTEALDAVALPELDAEARLKEASRGLEHDLERAGTFLLDLKKRRISQSKGLPLAQIQARRALWATWHAQAVDRFTLNGHLMALRKEILTLEESLLKRIADASIRPVLRTFRPLANQLREAEQKASQACLLAAEAEGGDLEALQATLRDVQQDAMTTLQEALSDLPGLVSADQALAEPGSMEWAALTEVFSQLPDQLFLHPLSRDGSVSSPEKKPWRMDVRLGAQDILRPFSEQLTSPAQPLRKQILRIWGETEQVSPIIQYNLDVALDVLKTGVVDETPEDAEAGEPSKDPLEDARVLATDGLRRAADTLMDLARSLEAPWHTFAEAVFDVFQNDWVVIHRTARTEALVEEQWYSFWMNARRRVQRLQRQARGLWEEYARKTQRLLRRGQQSAQALIERGRSAIGTVEATEEDRFRTIDAISYANVRALQDGLPLVYRKLFSLRPVHETSLLEGRQADVKRITQHFRRWKKGQAAGALMLAMPLGSGRTSLLNVISATLQSQADVCTLSLEERLFEDSDFAIRVAEALGQEVIGELSLETLETQLLEAPRTKKPRVCLIDNLEHLLLRTVGGSDLIERVLIFFSRTDRQICWIGTIGDYTWRFLDKTLGTATGLVTAYHPAALNAATLEAIIINRHRRSGMVLRFAEPKDLSPLVRRRLNRARTPEMAQTILREIYFERLHRLSGENVMLTLFYWLQSTDFKAEEGILTINTVNPLSFRFFESFDMARAFTMKAFILHHTLTLEDHNRIFRMDDAQSTYLLESLLNLGLIEPSSPEARRDAVGNPIRIVVGERYRLHPLILHPTLQLLKERNIV